jgi:nucleotide-binding universal stress UspA family protein
MTGTMLPRPDDWDDPVTMPSVIAPKRVLVPFDGSHTSERSLGWAAMIAKASAAEVVVVVAYEPPLTVRGRGASYVDAAREELAREAHDLATESVALLVTQGISARGIVAKGEPARAILDTADDESCDLIVLGRQGLSAELRGLTGALNRFRELLAGGVAEKVSGHARIPVLLVS